MNILSGLLLLVFAVAMAAPAYAMPCHSTMNDTQQEAPSVLPCHGQKADAQDDTTPATKPCCESGCTCTCAHAPGAMLMPVPKGTQRAADFVTYPTAGVAIYAMPVFAPPVSPPQA